MHNFQTNFKPQFFQFYSNFSRYFVPRSFSCAIFSSNLYLKLRSKLELQQTSNFITSHLHISSNIWAIKPIKLMPLVRSQTRKTLKLLTLEKTYPIKTTFFLPLHQHSTRLVTFAFQSFITLIRLEKVSEFLKKSQNFRKILQVSLIHRTNFFRNFYKFHHSHNTGFTKKYKSLPITRNKIFEKIHKLSTRKPKKAVPVL